VRDCSSGVRATGSFRARVRSRVKTLYSRKTSTTCIGVNTESLCQSCGPCSPSQQLEDAAAVMETRSDGRVFCCRFSSYPYLQCPRIARDWFRRIYRLCVVVDKQKQCVRPRSTALIVLSHDAGTKLLNSDSDRAYQTLSVAREAAESHGMGYAVYRQSFSCSVFPGKNTNTQISHRSLRVSACALREGGCGFVS
jgi:hypothetical protein